MSNSIANALTAQQHRRAIPAQRSLRHLLSMNDEELAAIDPLEMNLLVAQGIPSLSHLEILYYQQLADNWAAAIERFIISVEGHFSRDPAYWKNDVNFFRLGVLCQYVDCELTVRYREDQREANEIRYTDASDLFLNGVMDTGRGTCANMAALHVALGWRLCWPVSLACVGSHFVCRYDDGQATYNIEATQTEYGGFKSDPDDYLLKQYGLPPKAVRCGSDLRAVKPRELLGIFVGLRARHFRDVDCQAEAERDYLLARYLFPNYRVNCREQITLTALCNFDRFEPFEAGHPRTLPALADEVCGKHTRKTTENLQPVQEGICLWLPRPGLL